MRWGRFILIGAAILLAVVTAFLAQSWIEAERSSLRTAGKPAAAPQVRILVAKTNLGLGQFITASNVHWVSWPAASVAPTYFVDGKKPLTEITGSVVRFPMAAGEPVAAGQIVAPGDRGFLAAVLQPGMRAVSVSVSLTSGISGFIFPGDHVDIILTHVYKQGKDGSPDHKAGETVLTDVRVLAIDQKTEAKPGETLVPRSVTLEVTPKQSEVIAVASDMGKLSLSLRGLAGSTSEDEKSAEGEGGAVSSGDKGLSHTSYTLDTDASSLMGGRGTRDGSVTVLRGAGANGPGSK